MTDSERNLGRRWFQEVWNEGRRDAVAELLTPSAVIHDGGHDSTGPEGFYPFYDRLRSSFSDLHIEVEDSMAVGDKLSVRWVCTARHTGDGLGVPATGTEIRVTGISILRVADGKLVEGWQNWDMLGLLEQIHGGARSATYIR
jgi:steroid delta-isomerase-like uncharacterized protein